MDCLSPDGDEHLPPGEIIKRLQSEFPIVELDLELGQKQVRNQISYLRALRGRRKSGDQQMADMIAALESIADQAVHLRIADPALGDAANLSTLLTPNSPLMFGYSSREEEAASRRLIERCAKVLSYTVKVV